MDKHWNRFLSEADTSVSVHLKNSFDKHMLETTATVGLKQFVKVSCSHSSNDFLNQGKATIILK